MSNVRATTNITLPHIRYLRPSAMVPVSAFRLKGELHSLPRRGFDGNSNEDNQPIRELAGLDGKSALPDNLAVVWTLPSHVDKHGPVHFICGIEFDEKQDNEIGTYTLILDDFKH